VCPELPIYLASDGGARFKIRVARAAVGAAWVLKQPQQTRVRLVGVDQDRRTRPGVAHVGGVCAL